MGGGGISEQHHHHHNHQVGAGGASERFSSIASASASAARGGKGGKSHSSDEKKKTPLDASDAGTDLSDSDIDRVRRKTIEIGALREAVRATLSLSRTVDGSGNKSSNAAAVVATATVRENADDAMSESSGDEDEGRIDATRTYRFLLKTLFERLNFAVSSFSSSSSSDESRSQIAPDIISAALLEGYILSREAAFHRALSWSWTFHGQVASVRASLWGLARLELVTASKLIVKFQKKSLASSSSSSTLSHSSSRSSSEDGDDNNSSSGGGGGRLARSSSKDEFYSGNRSGGRKISGTLSRPSPSPSPSPSPFIRSPSGRSSGGSNSSNSSSITEIEKKISRVSSLIEMCLLLAAASNDCLGEGAALISVIELLTSASESSIGLKLPSLDGWLARATALVAIGNDKKSTSFKRKRGKYSEDDDDDDDDDDNDDNDDGGFRSTRGSGGGRGSPANDKGHHHGHGSVSHRRESNSGVGNGKDLKFSYATLSKRGGRARANLLRVFAEGIRRRAAAASLRHLVSGNNYVDALIAAEAERAGTVHSDIRDKYGIKSHDVAHIKNMPQAIELAARCGSVMVVYSPMWEPPQLQHRQRYSNSGSNASKKSKSQRLARSFLSRSRASASAVRGSGNGSSSNKSEDSPSSSDPSSSSFEMDQQQQQGDGGGGVGSSRLLPKPAISGSTPSSSPLSKSSTKASEFSSIEPPAAPFLFRMKTPPSAKMIFASGGAGGGGNASHPSLSSIVEHVQRQKSQLSIFSSSVSLMSSSSSFSSSFASSSLFTSAPSPSADSLALVDWAVAKITKVSSKLSAGSSAVDELESASVLSRQSTLINTIYCWVVDPRSGGRVRFKRTHVSPDVSYLLQSMKLKSCAFGGDGSSCKSSDMKALWTVLIEPVVPWLPYPATSGDMVAPRLIIVPDGILHAVPWPALRSSKRGSLMFESWAMSMSSSMGTLAASLELAYERVNGKWLADMDDPKRRKIRIHGWEAALDAFQGRSSHFIASNSKEKDNFGDDKSGSLIALASKARRSGSISSSSPSPSPTPVFGDNSSPLGGNSRNLLSIPAASSTSSSSSVEILRRDSRTTRMISGAGSGRSLSNLSSASHVVLYPKIDVEGSSVSDSSKESQDATKKKEAVSISNSSIAAASASSEAISKNENAVVVENSNSSSSKRELAKRAMAETALKKEEMLTVASNTNTFSDKLREAATVASAGSNIGEKEVGGNRIRTRVSALQTLTMRGLQSKSVDASGSSSGSTSDSDIYSLSPVVSTGAVTSKGGFIARRTDAVSRNTGQRSMEEWAELADASAASAQGTSIGVGEQDPSLKLRFARAGSMVSGLAQNEILLTDKNSTADKRSPLSRRRSDTSGSVVDNGFGDSARNRGGRMSQFLVEGDAGVGSFAVLNEMPEAPSLNPLNVSVLSPVVTAPPTTSGGGDRSASPNPNPSPSPSPQIRSKGLLTPQMSGGGSSLHTVVGGGIGTSPGGGIKTKIPGLSLPPPPALGSRIGGSPIRLKNVVKSTMLARSAAVTIAAAAASPKKSAADDKENINKDANSVSPDSSNPDVSATDIEQEIIVISASTTTAMTTTATIDGIIEYVHTSTSSAAAAAALEAAEKVAAQVASPKKKHRKIFEGTRGKVKGRTRRRNIVAVFLAGVPFPFPSLSVNNNIDVSSDTGDILNEIAHDGGEEVASLSSLLRSEPMDGKELSRGRVQGLHTLHAHSSLE